MAREAIKTYFGSRADDVLAAYGFNRTKVPDADPVLGDVGTQFVTDLVFRCPANEIAGLQQDAGAPVWRYQFGVPKPGARIVEHSAELKFVFDEPAAESSSQAWPPVQQYWVQFAKTGNPNGDGLPEWLGGTTGDNYVEFTPRGQKSGQDLREGVCRAIGGTGDR